MFLKIFTIPFDIPEHRFKDEDVQGFMIISNFMV